MISHRSEGRFDAELFVESSPGPQSESQIKIQLERKIHDAIDEAFATKEVK